MPATHTKHLRLRPSGTAPVPVEPPPVEAEEWTDPDMVFDTARACQFLGNCSESHLYRLWKEGRVYPLQDAPGCRLLWLRRVLKAYLDGLKKLECVGEGK